ncbi:MAG: hypothetical protein O2971_19265 [Proteobacteria bacterium]|nr:hypothetical protein [Pseudomonadota bacterium]
MMPGFILKKFLLFVGGFFVIFYAAFFLLLLLYSGPGEIDEEDYAYQLVTNWFAGLQIPQNQIELIDSYTLSGAWSGDGEAGFSVRVSGLNEALITGHDGVVRGDSLTAELDNALEFVADLYGGGELNWFPRYQEVLTPEYYVYPFTLDVFDNTTDSARLLILHPADAMAYFVYVKI